MNEQALKDKMLKERLSYPIEFKENANLIKEIQQIIACSISSGEFLSGKISHTSIENKEFIVYLEIELAPPIEPEKGYFDSLSKLLKF